MVDRVGLTGKKPEVNRDNLDSRMRRTNHSRSVNPSVDRILFLQKTVGNQAVQRLMRSGALQAKLRIGQPGDIYEQETVRVVDEVMHMPEPQAASGDATHIQRASPICEGEELRRQPIEEEEEELQRQPIEEEEEELQAKTTSSHFSETNPNLESKIYSLRGGGQPLPESARAYFEPRFGRDFSQVRVHSDVQAAELARVVNARAFTVGKNVVFGPGQFSSGSSLGKRLFAHE